MVTGTPQSHQVILVGNGPSALQFQRGELIDSFGTVVRFNDYILDGFQDRVGSRTDVWAVNEGLLWHDMQPPRKRPERTLVLVPWYKITEGCIWQRVYESCLHYELIDEDVARAMTDKFGPKKWPSTGTLAMAHFAARGGCTVTGFDHFNGARHHYANDGPFCGNHDPEMERLFTDQLIIAGAITRL